MDLRAIRILAAFDLRSMLRQRETILWMFVMPVLFMVLIGQITGSREGTPAEPVVGVHDADGGALAAALLARVDSLGYRIERVAADTALAVHTRQLRIPVGFTAGALAGEPQKVRWTRKGEATERAVLDRVRMQRALFLTLGDLAIVQTETGIGEGGSTDTASQTREGDGAWPGLAEALAEVRARPGAVRLDVTSAGEGPVIPDGFQQSVPGVLVMFVVLVLLTTGGVLLVIEREEGLLRRLASAPVTRGEILVAKLVARVGVGFVQVAFALLVGTLLRVDWGGRLAEILVLLGVYGIAMAALSLLFGNLARSRGQVVGFGVLAANLLGALGGCWWPIEVVPEALQRVAWFLPTGWAMYGMHRLMNVGESWAAIATPLLLLAGATLVFLALARRTFRYQ